MTLRPFAAGAAVLALSGCASIFNGQSQSVTIRSVPDSAFVSVVNRAGEKIHVGSTPVTLSLKRGAGYFKAETYTIVFAKDGFDSKELKIDGTMSGWYVGNIIFGGLIGMLAVDPVTGAMYTFPDSVVATLDAEPKKTSQAERSLTIVSTETLTAEQMKHARLLATR